jgi:hypothetical protein
MNREAHRLEDAARTPGAEPRVAARECAGERSHQLGFVGTGVVTSLIVLALAIWILGPRFSVAFPSMIDDWSNLDNAPTALHHLVRLDYSPGEVRDPTRYRPGYLAVWNSLVWRTFGAPADMSGPNVWSAVRLCLLLLAVVWLVLAAAPRSARGSPWSAALAAAPAVLLLCIGPFGVDYARLGPAEPLLTGGMVLGALLLVLATARWLRKRRWTAVVAPFVAGYLLWLLAVYQKEASVCFLVLAPFLYLELSRRWREDGTSPTALWRRRPFQVVAVLMVLPVLHMLVELARIAGGGETVYGTPIPSGTSGWFTRLHDAFRGQWNFMPGQLYTRLPVALALGATAGVVASGLARRRMPWLCLGLVACAWAVLVFQGLGGAVATRYYIPEFALFAVALAVALHDAPRLLRGVALAAVAALAVANLGDTRDFVADWARDEKDGAASVRAAAGLHPDTCPVYMGSMIAEYADALPVLIGRAPEGTSGACDRRFVAMLVYGRTAQVTPVTNEAIEAICADPGGWIDLRQTSLFELYGCTRLKDAAALGQDPQQVLAADRLRSGERYSERPK